MELIERYLYEVGRRLSPKTRDDILAELRSALQDKLDERAGDGQATRAQVIEILKAMGSPKKVATSFTGERYLIGPSLYPTMMRVLKIGLWATLVIPAMGIWSLLTTDFASMSAAIDMAVGTIGEYIGALANFITVVVVIFAVLEWQEVRVPEHEEKWDPEKLPAINQPGRVSYFDMGFEIAASFVGFALLSYFFQQGGVPLLFGAERPGSVVPIGSELLMGLMGATVIQIALQLFVMHRGAWHLSTRIMDALLDLVWLSCAFGAVQQFTLRLTDYIPGLHPFNIPGWPVAAIFGFIALFVMVIQGVEIYRLLKPRPIAPAPVKTSPAKG